MLMGVRNRLFDEIIGKKLRLYRCKYLVGSRIWYSCIFFSFEKYDEELCLITYTERKKKSIISNMFIWYNSHAP